MNKENKEYWENVWDNDDLESYRFYIKKYYRKKSDYLDFFSSHEVKKVCDCGCGFGGNSLALYSNGFEVFGFDISLESTKITKSLLEEYGLTGERFIVGDILRIPYCNKTFDAATARALLDHLSTLEIKEALKELSRITKDDGYIYASFDPLEEDDLEEPHLIMEDGSFLYTGERRNGLLFHYYKDDEIKELFSSFSCQLFYVDERGNRNIIVQKKTNQK